MSGGSCLLLDEPGQDGSALRGPVGGSGRDQQIPGVSGGLGHHVSDGGGGVQSEKPRSFFGIGPLGSFSWKIRLG